VVAPNAHLPFEFLNRKFLLSFTHGACGRFQDKEDVWLRKNLAENEHETDGNLQSIAGGINSHVPPSALEDNPSSFADKWAQSHKPSPQIVNEYVCELRQGEEG
jgi:hypothetical protein